jgi:hypothetical protein
LSKEGCRSIGHTKGIGWARRGERGHGPLKRNWTQRQVSKGTGAQGQVRGKATYIILVVSHDDGVDAGIS